VRCLAFYVNLAEKAGLSYNRDKEVAGRAKNKILLVIKSLL
jgi:hypothetical protein